jgi:hypothetical protein
MRVIADYAQEEPNIRVAGDAGCDFSLVYRVGSLLDRSEEAKIKARASKQNRKCHPYCAFA